MADERLDLSAWQKDGHILRVKLGVFASPVGPREDNRTRHYGQLQAAITCPEGSTCRRWAADHSHDPICFVQQELEAISLYDFIDMAFEGTQLASDWSSDLPLVIEWRDQGEDGIAWRPAPEQPRTAYAKLERFLDTAQRPVMAGVALKDDGTALASIEWGKEADDSPMVGAALYGTGDDPHTALADALKDKA